jgi:hypothetical protein
MIEQEIKTQLQRLLCETHKEVCAMRDESINITVQRVLHIIQTSTEPISIQTAIAQLEGQLADTKA